MMVAAPELEEPWKIENWNGVQVLRLKTPQTKDIGYLRRTIGEFLMPFLMLRNTRKSPLARQKWDGVVWVLAHDLSGPDRSRVKNGEQMQKLSHSPRHFPEWALDMGLIGSGLPSIC